MGHIWRRRRLNPLPGVQSRPFSYLRGFLGGADLFSAEPGPPSETLAFFALVAVPAHLRFRPLPHPGDLAAISNRPRVLSKRHVMTTPAMHACISAPTGCACHDLDSARMKIRFLFPSRSTPHAATVWTAAPLSEKSFIGPQVPINYEKPGSHRPRNARMR